MVVGPRDCALCKRLLRAALESTENTGCRVAWCAVERDGAVHKAVESPNVTAVMRPADSLTIVGDFPLALTVRDGTVVRVARTVEGAWGATADINPELRW